MPDLFQSLKQTDLGHLRMVAELWGVELNAPDARQALPILKAALLDSQQVAETVEILPEQAREAVVDLVAHQGRLPWTVFSRRYGEVRAMGPGRRDREQPHRTPVSPAEMLWYRALIARAFFDTTSGPEEFAYVPDDLLTLISNLDKTYLPQPHDYKLGRPATSAERGHHQPATDRILDDACTLLAARRIGLPEGELDLEWSIPTDALAALLAAGSMLDENGAAEPEASRSFLELPRAESLVSLFRIWRESKTINDLTLIPHLQLEGAWENDPLRAREMVLGFLERIPADTWWSLSALVEAIRTTAPDFQRLAGDYDSWFIRDQRTGAYLRGFENWDAVEGELIRFMITGPLHWLGVVDLAAPQPEAGVSAFRWTAWAPALLAAAPPNGLPADDKPIHIRSDGRLAIPRVAPRTARYQIARFCAWEGERGGSYRFRLTPAALERARESGLRVGHLLALLERYAETVPPSIVKALTRWEREGTEVRLEQVVVLRLRTPEMLKALRSSRAGRFLGAPLGPTTIIVKEGAGVKVLAILAEMGYLGNLDLA
jgi:hypothetical protein